MPIASSTEIGQDESDSHCWWVAGCGRKEPLFTDEDTVMYNFKLLVSYHSLTTANRSTTLVNYEYLLIEYIRVTLNILLHCSIRLLIKNCFSWQHYNYYYIVFIMSLWHYQLMFTKLFLLLVISMVGPTLLCNPYLTSIQEMILYIQDIFICFI